MYCADTIMMTKRTSTTSTIGVTLMPTIAPWPPPDLPPNVPAILPSDRSVELVQRRSGFRGSSSSFAVHDACFGFRSLTERVHFAGQLVLRLHVREQLLAQD